MELSCKVNYALLALLELAKHRERGKLVQIEQIAADYQIPDRYLAQLLMTLRRCGIVRSQRGAKGGYLLAREPEQITLLEVFTCLEGTWSHKQGSQAASLTQAHFAIEEIWQEATMAATAVLQRYTLEDLRQKRDEGQQSNPMYYI
ncbi:RrF2 family transcriptional regulator [Aerosakkonema funiforme]|uniref:RrF2 family transcriptional regulator n=1 Tax=Aerosakkonema funiforme TaxID=1246630 RepID=UPI0035B7ADF8